MKRFSILLLAALVALAVWPPRAYAVSRGDIVSKAAVLIDADTGQILFDKNMDERVYPASTTKIMTGVIAMEHGFPGELLTVTESAIDIMEPASSNISLTPGEELTLDDAMYALMLPSANDAANVIAEHIAGSQEAFVDMMNAQARAIGAVDTHFVNAHGLHEEEHYTTARDMATITRYAVGNEMFMRYFGADRHTMAATNKQPWERPFSNYQYMLMSTSRFYNPDVIAGKIGFTTPAGHTMSTVAQKDGRTLICVVMGSPNRDQKFYDTQTLLDFGFDEFTQIVIPGKDYDSFIVPIRESGEDIGEVEFLAGADFTFLLHNSIDPDRVTFSADAPDVLAQGEKPSATVMVAADAEEEAIPSVLAVVPLVTRTNKAVTVAAHLETEKPQATAGQTVLIAVCVVLGAAIVLFALYFISAYRRRQARLRRLERRNRERTPEPVSAAQLRKMREAEQGARHTGASAQGRAYSRTAR
ncbi:D-alanyl-D-alanine carboxypeptidase [Ruminococcaceae bacterium OttesenSCG-928-L11]|nr:D-alanyl-D-alanine carboxypeptidase [Ruminococcaceae bacterium OttesenSCG-928-L11]